MLQVLRGSGWLLFAVACVASVGCWDVEGDAREEEVKPEPRPTARADASLLRDQVFAAHHDRCVEVFVKTEGFGRARMPTLTHRPSDYPKSLHLPAEAAPPAEPRPGTPAEEPAASTWLMTKVELVSLLQHDKPGVYSADAMVSRIFRPKVRDLDEFEKAALDELREGEAVRLTEEPERVRMLGAIRARQDCLKCHSDKKEGDLLGAFSYVFERAEP